MALIELRGIKKRFGDEVVFDGIDLDIVEGEVITLMGASGSGKTLLMKMLIGLVAPDEGSIVFDGKEVAQLSEQEWLQVRKRIGMSFQAYALFDSMSVADNVAYGLREAGVDEEEIAKIVRQSLIDVDLPHIAEMAPKDLSGGMKKRVALARAMALRPSVMLYDEPTEGLDPINVTRVERMLLRLRDRFSVTSIIATHDMRLSFRMSDRLALIEGGKIAAVGSPRELRANPDPRLEHYVKASEMHLPTPSQKPPAP